MAENGKHIIEVNNWVDNYADFLFNYAITRVSDSAISEDLVQETFLSGLKGMKNFKGDSTERTWLVSILKRKIIDHYRKSNSAKGKAEVRMAYVNSSEQEGEWLEERVKDSAYRNAQDNFENRELGMAIENCLDQLPAKHALIFRQKTVSQKETEALCKEHDITPSNLWVIIHRARVQLMECLNEEWFKK